MSPEISLDLGELCRRCSLTGRTVRYYIQQGLLPAPTGRGPGARYGSTHLERLELIKRLRAEDLPLARIRETLAGLDEEGVREALSAASAPRPSSALEYVHTLLASPQDGALPSRSWANARGESANRMAPSEPQGTGQWRSQWEHITLAPDVELHVRRPLSRTQNRAVEELLRAARTLFAKEEP